MDEVDKIRELAGVSDTINQFLENELYKTELVTEDTISYQGILYQCYMILFQELKELGICINTDYDEALENYYNGDGFLALYKLLNADHLKQLMMVYPEYKLPFLAIFESDTDLSLEEAEQDHIQEFLNVYKQLKSDDPCIEFVDRISDMLFSTNLFKDHITTIIRNAVPTSEISIDDTEVLILYINKIATGQQMFSDVVHLLITSDPILNKEYLDRAIRLYDFEKVSGLDIKKYCWAVMSKDEELSEQERELKTSILFEHQRNQTHHIEYYLTNKIKPSRENLVELISHHVEPDSTKDMYMVDLQDMIKKAEQDKIFDADALQYLNNLNTIILNNLY